MFVWYVDNSSKNISADEQRDILKKYAQDNSYSIDVFLTDPDIKNIRDNVSSKNNTLIIANIACLGSKLADVLENIEFLVSSGFEIISIKENLKLDSSEETTQLIKGIKLSIDIRNSVVSTITKKALDNRKANGLKLGPAFGSKRKKCWSDFEEPIIKMLLSGMSRQAVAKKLGISIASLYNFIRLHPELRKLKKRGENEQ